MTSKRQRAATAIALLLIFSISQIYVQANLAGKSLPTTNAASNPACAGKLTTSGDNPINVNGNSTNPGTSILPGSQLLTPAGVGASVQIGKLGLLRMSPETSLTLNFTGSSVDVTLDSGYATLTTGPGVKGSITTPDGRTARTDSDKLSTVNGQAAFIVETVPALEPLQTNYKRPETPAYRACVRAAEAEYRRALNEAKENRMRAMREAEAEYRAAIRAATTDAQRSAARAAKRDAQAKAQLDSRMASNAARSAKQEAIQACQNQSTSTPTNSSERVLGSGSDEGVGMLGGISNNSARAFGLIVLGGAVASSIIYVATTDRGDNPSPFTP